MHILESVTSALRRRLKSVDQSSETRSQQTGNINRWALYKQLCIAKSEFGLNDRCLAVLSSLLSFLPDDQISTNNNPVVFPSNRQLSLRAHGMAESTLRRHLASLIKAGIIARKDSPNGKRYAHKDGAGAIELAFGFSFIPMIERAFEISKKAEFIQAQERALKLLRDEVSVKRREISAKFDDCEMSDVLQTVFQHFRSIVDAIPRRASFSELTEIMANLNAVYEKLTNLLNSKDYVEELDGSAVQFERHYNESQTESLLKTEKQNLFELKAHEPETLKPALASSAQTTLSLDMVLKCCPDIVSYAPKGIRCWRDLLDAASVVSSFLGISEGAWRDAATVMGREGVSAVVAWILQRSNEIRSPGGYLRSLLGKAKTGNFQIGCLLISSLRG